MKNNHIKKTILLSLLFCFAILFVHAQTYQQDADQVLLNLNKAEVTTGVLYDRVFPLANFQNFEGASTDDSTNSEHFHQAYYEFYNAMLNNAGYQTPEALNDYLKNNYSDNEHSIGIMLFNYNYLDTNAIKSNQLYSSNGLLYDNLNRTTSPWLQKTFFAATPLFPAETIVETGEHIFTFDPNLIISNTALNISTITVNFDDGYGDQQLYNNSGGGGTQTYTIFSKIARFFTSKTFLVRLTVVLTNGQTYTSITKVFTKTNTFKTTIAGCTGGDIINITGIPFNGSQYGRGVESAEGTAYIFYADANCATRTVTKPIIFLDGIDPDNSRNVQKIYDQYINTEITFNGVIVKLGDKLRADGYDIIVYDYKDGGDLMEKNALGVANLLQELYTRYSSTMQSDFVVIGPSMGSIVAQYALAYMETNNIPTHTRLYISFDGPHQGANASIGVQNLIDYVFQKGLTSVVFKKLANGINRVPAARQLLVHHSIANSEIPTPDVYRTIFLSNLQAVNKYPNQLRKIAIVNGSNNLSPNQYLQNTNDLLNIRIKRSGLLGIVNGKLGDRVNINIQAASPTARVETSDIWLFAPLLNLFLWQSPNVIKHTQPTVNNFSYDKATGSTFNDPLDEKTDAKIYLIQTLLYLFTGTNSDFKHNLNGTFMPTTSAIDLQTPNFTLAYNFSNENIVCTGKTPFDRVYAPTSNQSHVQITSENAVWFSNEIKETGITVQPGGVGVYEISGNNSFCNSNTITLTVPYSKNAIYNWSSGQNLQIISGQSTNSITIQPVSNASGNDFVTLNLTGGCGNQTI